MFQTVKLMDTIECRMIDSMRKKMAMEHAKLLAEKSREEGALPTDLWKKPVRIYSLNILLYQR